MVDVKKEFQRFYTNAEETLHRKYVKTTQDGMEFVKATEKVRYEKYPYFFELVEFNKYKGKMVLEIGVGEGIDHSQFAKNGAITYGIDLTMRHCQMTKKRFDVLGLSSNLFNADTEMLPFKTQMFDIVYSCGVLFLVPDIKRAAEEIYRVLKPGGKFIGLFYHKNSFWHIYRTIIYYGVIKGGLRYLTFDRLKDWYAGDGFGYPPVKYLSKSNLKSIFKKFRNKEFYITELDRFMLPEIGDLFSEEMLKFYEKRFGYYITIKTEK